MRKLKMNNNSMGVIKACSLGLAASIFTAAALSLIAPIFILYEYFDQRMLQWICGIIQLISTFTGALLSGLLSKDNAVATAVASSVSWFSLLVCAGILLFDEAIRGVLTEGLASLIGCVIAIFVLIRQENKPTRRKKKNRIH